MLKEVQEYRAKMRGVYIVGIVDVIALGAGVLVGGVAWIPSLSLHVFFLIYIGIGVGTVRHVTGRVGLWRAFLLGVGRPVGEVPADPLLQRLSGGFATAIVLLLFGTLLGLRILA